MQTRTVKKVAVVLVLLRVDVGAPMMKTMTTTKKRVLAKVT